MEATRRGCVQKKHPWTDQGWCLLLSISMLRDRKTPHLDGVSVSTTETPVYNRDLDCPLHIGESLSEQAALRYLVRECGWYWADAGLLKKNRFGGRVA